MESMTSEASGTSTVDDYRSPSDEIVAAVAAKAEVGPTELTPLYDTLDPEALDRLVTHTDEHIYISFEYEGYTVSVSGETVSVEE